jgi:hypothetical protein
MSWKRKPSSRFATKLILYLRAGGVLISNPGLEVAANREILPGLPALSVLQNYRGKEAGELLA